METLTQRPHPSNTAAASIVYCRSENTVYKRILFAIDGSETSLLALDAALQIAREAGAELQPVYIIDAPLMADDAPGYDPARCVDQRRNASNGRGAREDASAKNQRRRADRRSRPVW